LVEVQNVKILVETIIYQIDGEERMDSSR